MSDRNAIGDRKINDRDRKKRDLFSDLLTYILVVILQEYAK